MPRAEMLDGHREDQQSWVRINDHLPDYQARDRSQTSDVGVIRLE
jgi:hypothetical protein